ncbi:MAG: NAD(+) synthase [Coriobacteriia bacterium]|nr:NAD(+) synthase [Coriobacteriia bacterium]MCL2749419.1 NAD(+) synthase [Coriobacteriia bacterium]
MFIAVVQFNPKVGALTENCERALEIIDELAQNTYPPDLVIFPAFALSGAELGGLVTHNAFAAEALDVAQNFMQKASLPTLIGTVLPRPAMANTRFVCEEEILFAMGGKGTALGFIDMNSNAEMQEYIESIQIKLSGLSITIVLDDFIDPDVHYHDSDVIISMIARPYQETNGLLTASSQIDSLRADALANDVWIVVASLCGGEDAYVYEGASLVLAPNGSVVDSAPPFEEAVFTANLSKQREASQIAAPVGELVAEQKEESPPEEALTPFSARKYDKKRIRPLLPYEAIWQAVKVGLRDYVRKNGFEEVVLGLSGGIDSAVVAALAADALGPENVHAVLMPSPFSSAGSLDDSQALAVNLGINTLVFPITELYESFTEQADKYLGALDSDVALQNLQPRLRMNILMYLSNAHNWLLLNTSNKSEIAIGYSTLYGDTAGALAPLGSIYKTDVYGLAGWYNTRAPKIPQVILEKEPSAELFLGQTDRDALPAYDTLDQILRLHIEENLGVDEILEFASSYPIKTELDTETILDVLGRVRKAEFKRRQEPFSFQFDSINLTDHRAWPITNGFADHSRDIIAPAEIINYLSLIYRETSRGGFNFLDN